MDTSIGSVAFAALGGTALVTLLALATALARKGRSEDQARAYLAGFTYVLSDDPDAAIAELSRAAELNRQTLETYFALGALFRRKGELDRAVRLHTNIVLRPGVPPEVRRRAQLALARDYRCGGLRDKAAEVLEKVLAEEPEQPEALLELRQVHEESREWERAAELQARLVRREGKGQEVLAHLLAEEGRACRGQEPDRAEVLVRKAVALAPTCADAQLALAELLLARRAPDAAAPLEAALTLEPELAPRGLRLLLQAMSPRAAAQFLSERVAAAPDAGQPYELALALLERQQGRVDDAIARLRRLVERAPRLWEARRELGALLLEHDRSDELRADYEEILATLGEPTLGFVCGACRQRVPEHAFRCPMCGAWDSVRREPTSPRGS